MFINEVNEKYGDELTVLSEYKKAKEKVKFRHECGTAFEATPTNILTGHAKCPRCVKKKKYSYDDMVSMFNNHNATLLTKTFNGVYDKVEFICNKHPDKGVQATTYAKAIYSEGCCKYCGYERSGEKQLKYIPIVKMITEFRDKGLGLLDTKYKGTKAKYKCRCLTHPDEILYITYDNLKSRRINGCGKCRNQLYSDRKKTSEDIIKNKVESLGLIFDHVDYTGRYNDGTLVYYKCEQHEDEGVMVKKLSKINQKQACPYCNLSHGEREIEKWLNGNNVRYEHQKKFDGLIGLGGLPLSYDFYLPDQNVLIEFQGLQHERPVELFQRRKDQFTVQVEHDKRKKIFAETNNIDLLYIWYYNMDCIPDILNCKLGGGSYVQ